MLSAGVVHGDLSDFNVLLGADGPVLIDFPQSVDPAHNPNARKLLLRDVDNLHDFLQRHDRTAPRRPYAEEMWDFYQSNRLAPETVLAGRFRTAERKVDTAAVLALIDDANYDERRRREVLGLKGGPAQRPGLPGQRPQARPQHRAQQPRHQAQPGQQRPTNATPTQQARPHTQQRQPHQPQRAQQPPQPPQPPQPHQSQKPNDRPQHDGAAPPARRPRRRRR